MKTIASPSVTTLFGDPGQIGQIIMNLCLNARDAMQEGGTIRIETDIEHLSESQIEKIGKGKPGDYIRLSVTDTGVGIPSEALEHIFEPFYTTKEVGKGTGLGLATTYGIVVQHDGFILVNSSKESGTRFDIYFPAQETNEIQHLKQVQENSTSFKGTETILMAEDDQMVAEMVKIILTRAGYSVISATNGQEAIELYDKHKAVIDFVLLDVVMPNKSGKAVAQYIKSLQPSLPILFSSGYDFNLLNNTYGTDDLDMLIHKPYNTEELLRKIREILASTPPRQS